MKTTKFKNINIGETFYVIGGYNRIDQYEKVSDSFAIEVLTNSSRWFEEDVEIYID